MLAKHLSAIDQQPYYTPLNLFFNRLQRNLGETFDIRLLVKKIKTSLNHSKCIWTESNLSRSPFDIRQKYISAVSVTTRIIEKRPRLRLTLRAAVYSIAWEQNWPSHIIAAFDQMYQEKYPPGHFSQLEKWPALLRHILQPHSHANWLNLRC